MGEHDEVDWIDRTNETLGTIGNGYRLSPGLRSLFLTNNRIKVIENLDECKELRELVLRQNNIKVVQGLDELRELVELDLYMNNIEKIEPECFAGNPKLMRLDLSFNQIRELKGFPCDNLGHLEELFLIGNKIRQISDLRSMPKLVMLELGDNRLRKINELDALTSLQGLWLGRNKIKCIEGLTALTQLRRLSVQSNRIAKIEGLSHLVHLEELYLSHNGISSMDGIQNLVNLRVLDLGTNFIEHLRHLENLTKLKDLWMNGNKLQSFDELRLLRNATELETVYLEHNPLATHAEYQSKALELLPDSLTQLDALSVGDVRKQIAKAAAAQQLPQSDDDAVPVNGQQDSSSVYEPSHVSVPVNGERDPRSVEEHSQAMGSSTLPCEDPEKESATLETSAEEPKLADVDTVMGTMAEPIPRSPDAASDADNTDAVMTPNDADENGTEADLKGS